MQPRPSFRPGTACPVSQDRLGGAWPRSSLERRTLAGSEALLSFAYLKEEGALIPEPGWRAEPAEPPAGEWLAAHLFGEGK